MDYTIARLEEIHTGFTVDYAKSGNAYRVTICNGDGGRCVRVFNSVNEAAEVFSTLADAICKGLYNFEGRKKILDGRR